MREIEFRAVAKNKKRWVYGDLIHDGTGYSIIERGGGCIKVRPETVGQYTGRKDKKGKKIFEGDIIKDRLGQVGQIVYSEEYSAFVVDTGEFGYALWFDEEIEIIGNIWDNKGLLEERDA